MGEETDKDKLDVVEGREHLDLGIDGKIILKWFLIK
jgi:hypothetical protein